MFPKLLRRNLTSSLLRTLFPDKFKDATQSAKLVSQLWRLGRSETRLCSSILMTPSNQQNRPLFHDQNKSKEGIEGLSQQVRWRHSGKRRRNDYDRDPVPVKLMDFPEITYPRIVKSFRNRFFALLIRSYYDATFTLEGFLEAAKQV